MKVAGRPLSRWEDVSAVAECALALQQAVDSAGFERLGLSGLRGMRVAARAAAVFEGWDPIGGVTGLAVQPAEAPARPIARLQADRFETWASRGRGGDHSPICHPKRLLVRLWVENCCKGGNQMQTRRRVIGMMVSLSILLMTAPALARGATVTGGDFETFADGAALGYTIEGKARMVRTAAGTTIVVVNVTGLSPGATYGSHMHDKACGDNNAGGHYRFAESVPGGALDGHEIWPGPFTANSAGNAVGTEWVGATAGESAQSVVIHAPSGQKIACADLS